MCVDIHSFKYDLIILNSSYYLLAYGTVEVWLVIISKSSVLAIS